MLSMEIIKSRMEAFLPFPIGDELISDLSYCCSSITFENENEYLFRKGDSPKGFYWILEGAVKFEISPIHSLQIGEGSFVGMDNFASFHPHDFNIKTIVEKVETLFIDRRCYNNIFLKRHDLSSFMLQKHLNQLIEIKNNLSSDAVA